MGERIGAVAFLEEKYKQAEVEREREREGGKEQGRNVKSNVTHGDLTISL